MHLSQADLIAATPIVNKARSNALKSRLFRSINADPLSTPSPSLSPVHPSLTLELGLPELFLFPDVDELVLALRIPSPALQKLHDLSQFLDGHLSRHDSPGQQRHLVEQGNAWVLNN